MSAKLHAAPLLVATLLGAGCGGPTALEVRLQLDPALRADQLRFALASGDDARGPWLRPEVPHGPLPAQDSLALLVPDRWAGAEATVQVQALRGGAVVATVQGRCSVRDGETVPLSLALGPQGP